MFHLSLLRQVSLLCAIACAGCGTAQLDADVPKGPEAPLGPTMQTLPSHVAVAHQEGTLVRAMAQTDVLPLSIVLSAVHQDELDALTQAIFDPNSPQYGQYLSPEEFHARFHPDAQAMQTMREQLVAQGLEPEGEPHGLVWQVRASVARVEQALGVQMHVYEAPDGHQYHAPTGDVTVWATLPVTAIVGLYQSPRIQAHFHRLPEQGRIKPHLFRNESTFIRRAYNIPDAALGAGQVLSLFELDGYLLGDQLAYARTNGLPQPNLVNVLVGGATGGIGDEGGQTEVSLDIQVMMATAPNAKQIRVYEAPRTVNGFMALLNELANPSLGDKLLPKLISCSWGLIEANTSSSMLRAENSLFQQMAVQGQNFLAASGDSGSNSDGATIGVSDPSSQPFVVGVGGTTLRTTAAGAYTSETVWGGSANGNTFGSGGGISSFWPIPSYQRDVVSQATLASTTMRNVPDIALNSDPQTGYRVVVNGALQTVGGTSAAAPIWTAFLGLANEQRQAMGTAPIGFANPLLYRMNQTAAYARNFHDIADNTNNGYYPAVTGWDASTGWGSFDGQRLLEALAGGYPRRTFVVSPWSN